jgi:hypothetical protein
MLRERKTNPRALERAAAMKTTTLKLLEKGGNVVWSDTNSSVRDTQLDQSDRFASNGNHNLTLKGKFEG